SSQVWAEGYPTIEQTSRTPCLPLPGIHQWYRVETDKPVLQAMVGEAEHRSPSNMAAADLVEEIRSVGERLVLKLQRLPQAEPVELVAFSIIVLFTGNYGPAAAAHSLQLLLCALLLPREERQEDPRAAHKTQMRDNSVMPEEKLDRSLPEL
ncbi:hypothetical protein A6R68_08714, partial [Neotoma lepida]